MKFCEFRNSIIIILLCLLAHSTTSSTELKKDLSYLKIDIVEASNLHCIDNQDFECNPYANIEFKHSPTVFTTQNIECTKSPQWESSFEINPTDCKEVIYINFYQYLTKKNMNVLNDKLVGEDFEEGNIKMGYIGRIVLELEKLPFNTIDDWFMVESPLESDRIIFPACVHLRVSWTSTLCREASDNVYQIDSVKSSVGKKWNPDNYIPMCKKDFALIYKNHFTKLKSAYPAAQQDELQIEKCVRDVHDDYGFTHKSNLTDIEESLVYKIVKRTIGEEVVFSEIGKETNEHTIKEYKDFFEKDCYKKENLSISRINTMIIAEVENLPKKTTNPYVSREPDEDVNDYPTMLARERLNNVFNDTLGQFFTIEDSKNLDPYMMDDVKYLQTINDMVRKTRQMTDQNKVDNTLFDQKNKVILTKNGGVTKAESHFFTIYSLYKWNGGKFDYDTIKREYLLRRKNFECYERVVKVPTNIYLNFLGNECPINSVCVDPNGIVINSQSEDPRLVFADEISNTKIKIQKDPKLDIKDFKFKQKVNGNTFNTPEDGEEEKVNDILNFEKLVNSEINNTPVAINKI